MPPPVAIRPEPDGVALGDPAFAPLAGARADFGRLGGTVFQVEVPDHWNGWLVLFMHGYGELSSETRASAPGIRRYLFGQGDARGASSFSLDVVGPDSIAGCTRGATLTFRVDGRPVSDTAVNQPGNGGSLDLTVP
jgi:hypothetical protein